jgi:plasmid stabilization system protein ParE
MKPLKVAPAMTADLQQAYDYFKRGGSTAAERFLIRYEEAMRAVQLHPEICRVRPSGWRQRPIPRSSYALFYREAPDFWLIAAVISTVQDPDMIQAQLLIREIGEG